MVSLSRPYGGWKGMSQFMSERWLENFNLDSQEGRKATYAQKPEWESVSWASAEGWYYINYDNLIECIGCGGRLRMPLNAINLREYHASFYPWCETLNKRIKQHEQLRGFLPNRMLWHSAGHVIEYPLVNPCNPAMRTIGARKDTFTGGKTPNQWVIAGYYLPAGQETPQCWYCGVKMPQSGRSENVFVEHTLASPTCEHMKRTVGYLKMKEIMEYFGEDVRKCDKTTVEVDHRNGGKWQ